MAAAFASEITGTIEGAGYSTAADGGEVRFEIQVLPWTDPSQPAKCQVRLFEFNTQMIDHPIYGIDQMQALELSLGLIKTLVSMPPPSKKPSTP